MRVFRRRDGYSELDLLRAAIDHLEAAQHLFAKDPSWFDSAGYLSHLGLELLLKAGLLAVTDSFPGEHSLHVLANRLSVVENPLQLDPNTHRLLRRLDHYSGLRYPRPSDPVEIGTDDWKTVEATVLAIVDSMPNSLKEQFDRIREATKSGRILMRKRIE